jgi:hypothetical protein
VLGSLEGDAPARDVIEAQDREIAERSGRSRTSIKSIGRSVPRPARDQARKSRT